MANVVEMRTEPDPFAENHRIIVRAVIADSDFHDGTLDLDAIVEQAKTWGARSGFPLNVEGELTLTVNVKRM